MIHCFSINGYKLVLDVESGSLHRVDDTAYEILPYLQAQTEALQGQGESPVPCGNVDAVTLRDTLNLPEQEIAEALEEIRALTQAGQLFTTCDVHNQTTHMETREPVVKALCLHIAHACNLQCAYCFAGQGAYGSTQGLMSFETGKKAIDFLIAHSARRRNLEVDFFGGEPTLNFDTVKRIVAYGRSKEAETGKKFRFTLTTNGLLLDDEMMEYINEQMDNVVLSIDGRPEVNDRMRTRADGSGSYEDILPKFLKLAASRGQERYYVRGTYTHCNTDFAADVLHLADAGFTQISVEPAVSAPTEPYALRPEDIPVLCAEYEKLAASLIERKREGRPFRFFHFEIDLEGGPCVAKRVTGCGAGTEYLAVTPDGALFPCHQFVSEPSFCLGHLDTGIVKPELSASFAACNVLTKPDCADCWAKYFCSGGCAANAYHTRGDLAQPDETGCLLQQKRIECALYLCAVKDNS